MPPHGHGDDEEEEEEVISPRVDGPPFFDIHAAPGTGFEVDYDKLQKHLGPGKLSLTEFTRDMDVINKAYVPSTQKSYLYQRISSAGLFSGLVIFILMGIIGGSHEVRTVVMPFSLVLFLIGALSFIYSKWIEQGAIRIGSADVRKAIDNVLAPKYEKHPNKIVWTVSVTQKAHKSYHMGRTLLERPTVTVYCLKSLNAMNVVTEWPLPESILKPELPAILPPTKLL